MRKTYLAISLAMSIRGSGVSASAQKQTRTDSTTAQLLKEFEKDQWSHDQFYAAKAIVDARDARVLPKLEPWLTREDRQLRGNAAFVFAGFGDPRGFDVIVAILNDFSPRPATRNMGGGYEGPGSFESFSRAQTKSDRRCAAWLLGQLKNPRAVPVLVPLLKDRDIADGVAWSLGQIGDSGAIQPLIQALQESDPALKFFAIRALVDLKAKEALPALQQLLDDKSLFNNRESIAAEAQTAISKLQSKSAR